MDPSVEAGGTFRAVVSVTNTGGVSGSDVVQLYGHDVLGSVARPVAQLLGYHRVDAGAGGVDDASRSPCRQPGSRSATARWCGSSSPGDVEVWVGAHAADSVVRVVAEGIADLDEPNDAPNGVPAIAPAARKVVAITGEVHEVTTADDRWVRVSAG